jgi:plasmid stabilization system protein ParE
MAELDRQEVFLTSLKPRIAYLVNITPRAERDFARLYQQINAEESDAALKWYRGLKEAVLSLDDQPNRRPVTPKKGQLRHLLYGKKPHIYRVIFRVFEKQKRVDVLHIRHGARQQFKASDLG